MSILTSMPGLTNGAEPLPWLITAGQPSLAQFEAAAGAGVTTVIDLRDPMEQRPFDEPAEVGRLGMQYHNFPVSGGALDDATLERVLDVLRAQAGSATMLHCASANRTGGPLIAYLILDQGQDEQAAVDAAMRAGLRSAEIMEWGLDYARTHRR
jgi:protein tyrosine phosphatase (PTP) superfamily phosphohydrolase (DUF442 family)